MPVVAQPKRRIAKSSKSNAPSTHRKLAGASRAGNGTALTQGGILAKVGNEALRAKTGKTWEQWFAVLDRSKAHEWQHADIARYLHEKLSVPGWWCQMVAVGYEQAKGLRVAHQRPNGFEISKSKTVPVAVSTAFKLWAIEKKREQWLPVAVTIRKLNLNKSIRMTWKDNTSVEVAFYPKAEHKCQIVVQHSKLKDAKLADKLKVWWKTVLADMPI